MLIKSRYLLTFALVAAFAVLFFPVKFAMAFEIFGNPVISHEQNWLGPSPRNASSCMVDVGKVNTWVCEDTSVFAEHRYGCLLWLKVFGYSAA